MLPLFFLLACIHSNGPNGDDIETTANPYGPGDPWWDTPATEDADNDGYSIASGDCNDMDETIHPGVTWDMCDGLDNNCDGQVDEDFDGDADESENLGDLSDTPEYYLYPRLFPETDIDVFEFYVDDPATGWFDIEVWLYQVPDDADYQLELYWIEDSDGDYQGRVQAADVNGMGGFETINYGGRVGRDDSGWYRIVVQSYAGSSCTAPYQLQFLIGGW